MKLKKVDYVNTKTYGLYKEFYDLSNEAMDEEYYIFINNVKGVMRDALQTLYR